MPEPSGSALALGPTITAEAGVSHTSSVPPLKCRASNNLTTEYIFLVQKYVAEPVIFSLLYGEAEPVQKLGTQLLSTG